MRNTMVVALLVLGTVMSSGQSGPNPNTNDPESRGLIKGKVVDEKSKVPMEYTSIAIYKYQDSTLVTGTVTNEEGEFELSDLPFGRYYLELHFVGYNKTRTDLVMVSPEMKKIDMGELKLSVNTSVLDEVEIVADQRRVEYKIDKKVVNVSEDLSAAGGTAVDVLENTPSVTVDIEGNVSLRGSSNFTVLINGKPTVLDPADALRQIPASSIQNIEIITNPSVKYDPDGNGGILNVVLKKQVERGTTGIVNATVGLNHKYRLDALINRRVGKLNYFIGGNYNDNNFDGNLNREHITYSDGGIEEYNTANGNFDFTRGGSQLKAGLDYDLSSKSNLAFEGSGGSYSFGIDRTNYSHEYTIPSSYDNYYLNKDIMSRKGNYYNASLNLTQSFDTSAHKLVVMAYFSQRFGDGIEDIEYQSTSSDYSIFDGEFSQKNRNVESENNHEYRIQLDYTKPFENGTLETGYQARIDDNMQDFVCQEYDPDTDQWNPVGANSSEITFFRNIQSGYVQYAGQINKIQFQAGLRGEYTYRQIDYKNFSTSYNINRLDYYPTLHLSRQLVNDQQLMLSYSKRVNRPRGHDLDSIPSYIDKQTIRIGNPGLEPEYVNSFELGYQKGWGKNFLAFETYYRKTNNLISRVTEYDEESGIFYQKSMNLNEDHVLGSELMANWQFAKWFNLNASTNVYYYRIQGELLGESFENSNISWRANANATFVLSRSSRIQSTMGYHGPSVTAQGSAEGMFYMNLALRQDFLKRKLSATLQVRDLLGTMKREFTASGDGFSQYVLMQREPRVLMLSLSYKINNYRMDSRRQSESGDMEMDAGF